MKKASLIGIIWVAICYVFVEVNQAQPSAAESSTMIQALYDHAPLERLQKIDSIMFDGIQQRAFPGGVVAIVQHQQLVFLKAYGKHTYETDARAYRVDDIFDLASITKTMATTSAIIHLMGQGKLQLQDSVSKFLPSFQTPEKRGITLRQLLLHESGLPAFKSYVDRIQQRNALIDTVLHEKLLYPPGSRYVYSDLGFITLGEIVEKISGVSLETYTNEYIFRPLDLKDTRFNPLKKDFQLIDRIPPTEYDTVYRKKRIHGEVHDERAWYLDGYSGHAGLFSSATDLAKWVTMLMNHGQYQSFKLANDTLVSYFTQRHSTLAYRALGFDMKSQDTFSSAGTRSSIKTYGHTGFTGTSFWIDPERGLAIIMLTNRTWPLRTEGKPILPYRAAVVDAAIGAFE
jgi:CubicO group peptidase (beta-lactamase class C family)